MRTYIWFLNIDFEIGTFIFSFNNTKDNFFHSKHGGWDRVQISVLLYHHLKYILNGEKDLGVLLYLLRNGAGDSEGSAASFLDNAKDYLVETRFAKSLVYEKKFLV